MTLFTHLYSCPAPAVDEGDDAIRQPRERACLCNLCLERTTWQVSGQCLVCRPYPLPLRPKAEAA